MCRSVFARMNHYTAALCSSTPLFFLPTATPAAIKDDSRPAPRPLLTLNLE